MQYTYSTVPVPESGHGEAFFFFFLFIHPLRRPRFPGCGGGAEHAYRAAPCRMRPSTHKTEAGCASPGYIVAMYCTVPRLPHVV